MKFQKIVIIIAIIMLIAALTFIGYALYTGKHNEKFPPIQSACPDYWAAKDSECVNSQPDLGHCTSPMNFDVPHYRGDHGDCNKSKWAKDCGVTWDGITNNPNICKS